MRELLRLLLYSSVLKSKREPANLLFAIDRTGRYIVRANISKPRFLSTGLQFDNSADRKDPLPTISELFNNIIKNYRKSY